MGRKRETEEQEKENNDEKPSIIHAASLKWQETRKAKEDFPLAESTQTKAQEARPEEEEERKK